MPDRRLVNNRSISIDPVTDERFELVRQLGEGASGAVYLALDRETGEQVGLKKLFKLDQKSAQRSKHELPSLADIHHPNLVKLYDLQRGRDAWFITMEYVACGISDRGANMRACVTELMGSSPPRRSSA